MLDSFNFLTDLSPNNVCDGATDPVALASLLSAMPTVNLKHLPKLHAKVYISDTRAAIVTSGNLTAGGLYRNYEYGVRIQEQTLVSQVLRDISAYSELGASISPEGLGIYCRLLQGVEKGLRRRNSSVARPVRLAFQQAFAEAELQLVRFRLAEGAMPTIFAKTLVYLLSKHGPLSTEELHLEIQAIHPDLCDDGVDRVIDGKHFGKRWKHAVRSAQQHLKKSGRVVLKNRRWHMT